MKIFFLLFAGLMFCLSISGVRREPPKALSIEVVSAIEEEMETRFALRDNFIDKSNRGHFVKTHEIFKRHSP